MKDKQLEWAIFWASLLQPVVLGEVEYVETSMIEQEEPEKMIRRIADLMSFVDFAFPGTASIEFPEDEPLEIKLRVENILSDSVESLLMPKMRGIEKNRLLNDDEEKWAEMTFRFPPSGVDTGWCRRPWSSGRAGPTDSTTAWSSSARTTAGPRAGCTPEAPAPLAPRRRGTSLVAIDSIRQGVPCPTPATSPARPSPSSVI